MSEFGYDKDRFPNLQGEMFDCIICSCVVINAKECSGCGNLFCGKCIDSWKLKNTTCPNRCNGIINPMVSKALLNIYNDLDIKCSKGCNKVIKMYDLPKHQINCSKVRCFNYNVCEANQNKQFGTEVCSERCQLLKTILGTHKSSKKIYDILIKFKPKEMLNHSQSTGTFDKGNSQNKNEPLKWNTNALFCGQGVAFENGGNLVILKQTAYVFRTAIGSYGFTSGCHYWEISGDHRTQNELKIGVSTSNSFDFNTAFCDHVFGFSYYGLGQLRHNSNASGPQYGKKFKKEGILGVYLNMDKGTLSFALNGETMGEAYNDPLLKKGPIYPAVSLLHAAACTIKGQLPIPQYFKDK